MLRKTTATVDVVKKVTVLCQLHQKKGLFLRFHNAVALDEVGVIDLLQEFNLTGKELDEVILGSGRLVHNLQRKLQCRMN